MLQILSNVINSKNLVHKSLDASWIKNEVISKNIANVNTPGYKRQVVSFEAHLKKALADPDFTAEDVKKIEIKVKEVQTTSNRLDGNNVNIDVEMTNYAKNTIQYNALTQMASYGKHLKVIRSFSSGG